MSELGPKELRLMQGLARRVTAIRPEVLNGGATVGELAWGWAKDFDALSQFWRHRMWFIHDELIAWGWACLPHRIPCADGSVRESKAAKLTWQVHPDHPSFLVKILGWYDDAVGNVDRRLTAQSRDDNALATLAAHGYGFDAKVGSTDGSWVQFNMRELAETPEPVLPASFRFLTADGLAIRDVVGAHRAGWPRSDLSTTTFERVRGTWPYREDLHVMIAAQDSTLVASAIIWLDEMTRTAEFEPVRTHIDFQRRGLGTALLLHGMQMAKAAGANRIFAACPAAPTNATARNMYHGVGFGELSCDQPHTKFAT